MKDMEYQMMLLWKVVLSVDNFLMTTKVSKAICTSPRITVAAILLVD